MCSLVAGRMCSFSNVDPEHLGSRIKEEHALAVAALEESTQTGRTPARQLSSFMSAMVIAEKFGVTIESLRKKLERFRKRSDSGWTEVADARPREPRYLYMLEAIQDIL